MLALTLRRYLQAFNHVAAIAITAVTANVVNAVLDWLFLFPHQFGSYTMSSHGVVGAAISTALARLYMALFFIAAIWYFDRKHSYGLRTMSRRIEAASLKQLASSEHPLARRSSSRSPSLPRSPISSEPLVRCRSPATKSR